MIKYKSLVFVMLAAACFIMIVFVIYRMNNYNRQSVIHNMGNQVMPFNLDQTKHIFKLTEDGGIQQVIVIDSNNKEQISMIRQHLKIEANNFSKGNFSDPALLHGKNMPGLNDIKEGSSNINITYSDLPNGGQIIYKTKNTKLIKALHIWFDAQLSDHGNDAMKM